MEWVDAIPQHWDVLPLSTHVRERTSRNTKGEKDNILSLSYGQIVERDVSKKHGLLPATFEAYTLVEPGSIILRLTDLQNDKTSLRVGLAKQSGAISSAYTSIDCKDGLDSKYAYYLLHSYDITKVFYGLGAGVRQTMGFQDVKRLPLILPSPPEQHAIVDFLDARTQVIDDLIAKKERLIELLEEKRTALITRSVTKGLDPDVPMKDSGVEWLGQIPDHWSTTKIRHLSSVQRGASPRPISDARYFDENGEYGWVRIRDVTSSGMYLRSTEQTLSQLGKDRSVPLGPGRVILSIAATVGEPIITDIKCCIHDGFVYFENLSLEPEFLYFILKSHGVYSGLGKLGTQLNLNTDTVGDIRVPVPGLDEQRLIVAHLKNTRQVYMAALNGLDQATRLLDEYRSALITAAVTGKIDVRDHAA